MADYSKLTDEMFDKYLIKILKEESAEEILRIPGAYEVFSEHFNNDVLDMFVDEHPEWAYGEDEVED